MVTPTPLQLSDRLSATTGANVYLKREDLQTVRSYKLRGAYNLLVQLSDEELAAGVVCSSAGNHAQGFAYACRTLGIRGRVYVPAKTPKQKRDRIRYHGGEFIELIVGGSTYDLAAEAALADVAAHRSHAGPAVRRPAHDGRPGHDRRRDARPARDGGSRTWWWSRSVAAAASPASPPIWPNGPAKTSVLGIEPAGAAAMMAALANGGPVTLDHVDQFVDGAAVSRAGRLTYAALAAAGDMVSITTVDEGAVCTAMLDLYQNEGIIAEPAGALAVTGLLEADIEPGSTVVCLVSGGNNDVSRYGEVLERSLVHLGSSTISWSTSRRSPARCAGSWTACSDPTTTSRCSSTSSATTGRPVRRWSVSSWARPRTWTACWSGCGPPRCRSKPSNRVRRPTAICCSAAFLRPPGNAGSAELGPNKKRILDPNAGAVMAVGQVLGEDDIVTEGAASLENRGASQ